MRGVVPASKVQREGRIERDLSHLGMLDVRVIGRPYAAEQRDHRSCSDVSRSSENAIGARVRAFAPNPFSS